MTSKMNMSTCESTSAAQSTISLLLPASKLHTATGTVTLVSNRSHSRCYPTKGATEPSSRTRSAPCAHFGQV